MDTDQLREEIRDFHKIRIELHKWKVIAVAVLGAIGLGLSGKEFKETYIQSTLILSLIPLLLLYIDILQRDLVLKIRVIGKFLNEYNQENNNIIHQQFEKFVVSAYKEGVYNLEGYASNLSSILINILLFIYAFAMLVIPHKEDELNNIYMIIIFSSILGFILTISVELFYKDKKNKILNLKI